MELTAEQDAKFRELCGAIMPGEYGRVIVSFIGEPSNMVQITGEKTCRFQNLKNYDPAVKQMNNSGNSRSRAPRN